MNAKNFFRLMAMVLIGTAMTMMTSCKNEEPSLANEWYFGRWYMELNKKGTLGTDSIRYEYTKVVLCGDFGEKYEGFWSLIYVDSANHAISPNGESYWANCQYTVQDKTVRLNLNPSYLPMAQKEWTLTYDGDCLETMYENQLVDLHRIKTQEYEQYQIWMRELGFGFTEDDQYNINDKDINGSNWRDQAGLYIYDGKGTDVKDEKGRTGYTAVYFPWYKGGVVDTNLDPEFCDDITPENGWEWVLNLCGSRSIVNNNFFALYNKYSGVLRFFYYMPNNVTSGTDHMWEIDMTNMMAQRSVWGYGLPMDLKISDKAAIGQDNANFFVDYITPYVRQLAPDGTITPNQGWWAFDIDLSLYRPNDNGFADNQSMSLQIRSWDVSHVSLTSAITGKLDGEMQLDQTKTRTIVSKKKGLFGFIKDGIKIGKTAAAAIVSAKSGDVKGALKNGISAAKDGYSLYGAIKNNKNSSTTVTDTLSRLTGTFNASVQADAETDGIIQSSKPVMGAASPTIPCKQFIKAGTHIGDGVWNLKTSPMVYAIYSQNMLDYWLKETKNYYAANWIYFDPSSVEVVLNPEVFPESEIEWMQVDAVAIARKEKNWKGTDPFRLAMGLKRIEKYEYITFNQLHYGAFTHLYGADVDNYVFNFVGAGRFDGQTIEGTHFPTSYEPFTYKSEFWDMSDLGQGDQKPRVFGCGTEDYIIEPQIGCAHINEKEALENNFMILVPMLFPAIEVNVSVLVKLTSQEEPILLSRNYLPVFQDLDILLNEENVLAIIDRIYAKQNLSPKTAGHTGSYDFQAARINKCFKLLTGYSR